MPQKGQKKKTATKRGPRKKSKASAANVLPSVNAAKISDLTGALSLGWKDYCAAPKFGLFFGAVYMAAGIILVYFMAYLRVTWMAYPLVIGFSLIGPFVATGLYEVSRRLESSQPMTWRNILGVVWDQHRRELGWMAFVMLFVFWVWMYQIRTLVAVFFGSEGFATIEGFLEVVFTTSNGLLFLAVGHVVGAVLSIVLFTLTVVSVPLLLDREIDFVSAMITSIRAVAASPIVMIGWGLFVVVVVIVSSLPAFAGLLISLPVFGHATWHLYKKIVQ